MTEARFCPNCGSLDVEPDRRHTNVLGDMVFNQDKWFCNECSYTGLMPSGDPENFDENSEEIEFEPKEQETVDTDAGQGYFKYLLYIALPAILIYILLKTAF